MVNSKKAPREQAREQSKENNIAVSVDQLDCAEGCGCTKVSKASKSSKTSKATQRTSVQKSKKAQPTEKSPKGQKTEHVTTQQQASECAADAATTTSSSNSNSNTCTCTCGCGGIVNTEHLALPNDDVEIITAFFKALSDPTRFNIVYALLQNEQLSVGDISQLTQMSMSAVSHQLAVLRMRKLVKVTRDGVKNYYSLCDDHVAKVIEMAIEHIHE